MYHIFFIHSSVIGHLGCFRVLAFVNNAAVNIGVRVPEKRVSFNITPVQTQTREQTYGHGAGAGKKEKVGQMGRVAWKHIHSRM